jgi:hypothetical protein
MELVIYNGGGGLAKQTAYVLVSPETRDWAYGYVGHGFVRPDETVRVFAAMQPYGVETQGVLHCRDVAENTWGWNLRGDKEMLRSAPRRPKIARRHHSGAEPLDQKDMLRAFYPDIDPNRLDLRDSRVIESPTARPKGK